jgi:hypothetical protein
MTPFCETEKTEAPTTLLKALLGVRVVAEVRREGLYRDDSVQTGVTGTIYLTHSAAA